MTETADGESSFAFAICEQGASFRSIFYRTRSEGDVVVASTSEVVGERRQTTGNGIGGNDPNVPLARRKTEHLVLTGPIPLASR